MRFGLTWTEILLSTVCWQSPGDHSFTTLCIAEKDFRGNDKRLIRLLSTSTLLERGVLKVNYSLVGPALLRGRRACAS